MPVPARIQNQARDPGRDAAADVRVAAADARVAAADARVAAADARDAAKILEEDNAKIPEEDTAKEFQEAAAKEFQDAAAKEFQDTAAKIPNRNQAWDPGGQDGTPAAKDRAIYNHATNNLEKDVRKIWDPGLMKKLGRIWWGDGTVVILGSAEPPKIKTIN